MAMYIERLTPLIERLSEYRNWISKTFVSVFELVSMLIMNIKNAI